MFRRRKNSPILRHAFYDVMWDWNVPESILAENQGSYLPSNWIMDVHTMLAGADNRKYV